MVRDGGGARRALLGFSRFHAETPRTSVLDDSPSDAPPQIREETDENAEKAFLVRVRFDPTRETDEERDLNERAGRIKAAAEAFAGPSTFLQHTKMTRYATQLEAKAARIERERRARASNPWGMLAHRVLGYRVMALVALAFVAGPGGPIFVFPSDAWMWPFSTLLTIGGGSSPLPPGGVSLAGWIVLNQRVWSRLLRKAGGG